MTDSAITKKSKRSIWIPLLVLITLAACATAGYSYWRMQQEPSGAAAKADVPLRRRRSSFRWIRSPLTWAMRIACCTWALRCV